MTVNDDILRVEAVSVHFSGRRGVRIKAVDEVSFAVKRGSTFGLVGESGCGKSTTGSAVLMLQRPNAGKVIFDGIDLGRADSTKVGNGCRHHFRGAASRRFSGETLRPKRSEVRAVTGERRRHQHVAAEHRCGHGHGTARS